MADQICSIRYDWAVVEADKRRLLLLGASPHPQAVKEMIRIKEILEA